MKSNRHKTIVVMSAIGLLTIGTIFFLMVKNARRRHFLIERKSDSLVISLVIRKVDTHILTITNLPSNFVLEQDVNVVRNGDVRTGDIGWRNVDLGFLDDHMMVNIGKNEYWILLAKYLDDSGKVVEKVEYKDSSTGAPNKEMEQAQF